MNLFIVSHPCVTPINQDFYAEIESITGWDLTIVAPQSWKTDYGPRELERWPDYQGRLIPIPVSLSGNVPLHIYHSLFTNLLREVDPDVIYVHNEAYSVSAAQVLLANRLSVDAPMGFYTAQNIVKRYPIPFRWTEQAMYNHSQFAFPVSTLSQDLLREKGFEGPAPILPLGVDSDLFYPRPDADELREEWGVDSSTTLLGYVGRLTPGKGLFTILDALDDIRSLPWHFVVVGSGEIEDEFDEKVQRRGLSDRVTRTGYIPHDEVPRYFSALDIHILASETGPNFLEQFGRVQIEALACDTALIGSNSGEIPNVIDRTEGGLIFQEGSATELADRLRTLILNPEQRREMAQTGRQFVLDNYTNEAVARRFAETVESIVAVPC